MTSQSFLNVTKKTKLLDSAVITETKCSPNNSKNSGLFHEMKKQKVLITSCTEKKKGRDVWSAGRLASLAALLRFLFRLHLMERKIFSTFVEFPKLFI